MLKENYVFTEEKLLIYDEELGLDIHYEHFCPYLPKSFESKNLVLTNNQAYLMYEGKQQGECRWFFEDKTCQAILFYDQGLLHGPSTFFGPQGQILTKSWYYLGKKVGKTRYFYSSQKPASIQRFMEGRPEGLQEYFYETGTIKSQIPYRLHQLDGQVRLFWESGSLKRSIDYQNGQKHGWDRLWNEEQVLLDEGCYEKGDSVGVHRHFFCNQKLREEKLYHTPKRYNHKRWNQAGQLIFEGIYTSDRDYVEKTYSNAQMVTSKEGMWDGKNLYWK